MHMNLSLLLKYFRHIYNPFFLLGDLRNDNQVIKWMLDELKQEEIKHVTVSMLNRLIDRNHNLAVVFMDEKSKDGKYSLISLIYF